jgi:hypothetical protein
MGKPGDDMTVQEAMCDWVRKKIEELETAAEEIECT